VLLPADHKKINKFTGPDDQSYLTVSAILQDMAQEADEKVNARLNRAQYLLLTLSNKLTQFSSINHS
jgi:hypothetical protein